MSNDNNNNHSDPFDFDFESLNEDNSAGQPADSFDADSFDINNPFGDDVIVSPRGTSAEGLSADNPYLDDTTLDSISHDPTDSSEQPEGITPNATDKKKKGFWGGKGDKKKVKPAKEPSAVSSMKEKKPRRERTPQDSGSMLCIAFSVFLLVSLLIFNIASFLTIGGSIMQTLCFLGAFNLVGLAAASVPILFYRFPQERTLMNVMLGVAAFAMLTGVQVCVVEFYRYGFVMIP